jgi:hypothetical protein
VLVGGKLSILLEGFGHFLAPGNSTVQQTFELKGVII